jgi:nicotinamidase-related amidase
MNKALLLVVDVQNGFLKSDETKAVVPRINELIETWEGRRWPVVYSRFINLADSNWERLRDWHELKAEPDTLLADELKVAGEYVFKKSSYSAWSSDVESVCHSHGVSDIVIVGVDTNECVLATALAVFDAGMTPWVVEDCCASGGGDRSHEMAIELMKPLLGEQQIITSSDTIGT